MQFRNLQVDRDDALAIVTLARPDRLNALDLALIESLSSTAQAISADPAVRAVLLRAAGRAFCAGADLVGTDPREGAMTEAEPEARAEAVGRHLRERFNPMIAAWRRLRVPVVVAVQGVAAGAGASLALCGDLVIAARSATFVQSFAPRLALMPDLGGSFHLPRLVGSARAKGLALLGDPLSATEAASWGLIWAVVDDAELEPTAVALARRLTAGPTAAYRRIKQAFGADARADFDEQIELEARLQAELAGTEDFAEGVKAFLEKRPPRFAGR